MTAVRDLADHERARLAARLIDEVGMHAVNQWRDGITVLPPEPGASVLACRCGAVLALADMQRQRARFLGTHPPIRPIVCRSCA